MEPLEATPLRVTVGELDIGIDTFKLAIRLSKAKRLAFPFISLFAMSCRSYRPLRSCRTCTFADVRLHGTAGTVSFPFAQLLK